MRRVLVRSVLVASLAATLVTGTALGHECFVASRSEVGNIAAGTNSKAWLNVASLRDLFTEPFLFEVPLAGSQLDWAIQASLDAGLPSTFTIFVGNHTIADGTPAMARHAADGKGIDHIVDWFPVIVGIYAEAQSH